jgi:hypothetical protein
MLGNILKQYIFLYLKRKFDINISKRSENIKKILIWSKEKLK